MGPSSGVLDKRGQSGPTRRDMRTMSGGQGTLPATTRSAAADWVVRLQAPSAGEADWLTFEAWLAGEPGARAAYDEAMATWLLADRLADDESTSSGGRL